MAVLIKRLVSCGIIHILLRLAVVSVVISAGCSVKAYMPPGSLPMEQLSEDYTNTSIRDTSSLDVLHIIQSQGVDIDPVLVDTSVVTQSDKAIASSGRSKDGYKNWFTMFVFDTHDRTTQRKYFYYMDERTKVTSIAPKRCLFPPRQTLVFRSEVVLGDILTKSYPTNHHRQIAVIQEMASLLRHDIKALIDQSEGSVHGSDVLAVSGMLMNQVYRDALLRLNRYPSMAHKLEQEGVLFDHISLDGGRIRLQLQDNIATIKIEVGIPLRSSPPIFANSQRMQ